MASNLKVENDDEDIFLNSDKCVYIVNLLTKFKIKLWELPDLETSSQPDNSTTEDLLLKLSDESGIVEIEVRDILSKLQKHSLKKLESNKRFAKDGLASFKLKIIGNNNQIRAKTFSELIEASIYLTGAELSALIQTKFELNCDSMKIICNGKVIKSESPLYFQEVKNHSSLMVMCVYENLIREMSKSAEDFQVINDIKDAVNILTAEKKSLNDEKRGADFRIKNQNGVSLEISTNDTQCLTTAMILHEKGKILMRGKDYLKALIVLAEADNEFKNCSDRSLLDRVDNYALLNLDIIWCYLNLQNLHELKNAEERIYSCEKCLEKCYGADMARLSAIKNESANKHIPIYVRLNLLKAILNYHRGKKKECRHFLDIAKEELRKVVIDEDKLTQIMSMGFSCVEARLALRAALNNVDVAIEQIFKKKRLEKESKRLEAKKDYEKQLENNYGRTMVGNKAIDVNVLNDLLQFGYKEKHAARALIRTENDFNLALDILQTKEDELESDNDETSTKKKKKEHVLDETKLAQLVSMGYELEMSKLCLEAFQNNLDKVFAFMAENSGENLENEIKNVLQENKENRAQTSTSEEKDNLVEEKTLNALKLIEDLKEEMPDDDEAYLDLNLDEDSAFIQKYYSLLGLK